MKILITGATGLIGSAIVKEALKRKHSIHFLTTSKKKIVNEENLKGFYWNPIEKEIDVSCFEGVDAVIHLAGASVGKYWTDKHVNEIYLSRKISSNLLYESIKELKGKHQIENFVSASAIGIYPTSASTFYNEEAPVVRYSLMENIVFEWEKAVSQIETLNITVAKLRIGLVLARDSGVLGKLKTPISFGLGAAFGNGKQGQSWIHIDDLVSMFLICIKQDLDGVYNAVSPYSISQSDMIKEFSKVLQKPYFMPPIPAILVRLLLGRMSVLVLDSHWVSAFKILDAEFKFKFPKLKNALLDLYPPISSKHPYVEKPRRKMTF